MLHYAVPCSPMYTTLRSVVMSCCYCYSMLCYVRLCHWVNFNASSMFRKSWL